MSSNNTGRGRGVRADHWAAFDKLPRSFREAIANADHLWASSTILARHRRAMVGYRSPQEFAETIKAWDKIEHQRAVKRGLVCPGQR
jgi:hypothetical protein